MVSVAAETVRHIALIARGEVDNDSFLVNSLNGQDWSMATYGNSVEEAKKNFLEGSLVGSYFRHVDGFQPNREILPSSALEALLTGKGATYHSSVTVKDSPELWAELQADLRQKGLPGMPDYTVDFYVVGARSLLH